MRKSALSFLALAWAGSLLSSCASGARRPTNEDPHQWLENPKAPEALEWARERNARTELQLASGPRFDALYKEIHSVLVAKDRIPEPRILGEWVYNFWQDSDHVRGLWRRARLSDYPEAQPGWETVLDLDALASQEGASWVWKGASCLPPDYRHCLLRLSRGGKDAVVVREFDVQSKSFVQDGFNLPEAKSRVAWMDADTLWVGTDFGPGSLTQSGYPRIAKLWRRGKPLAEAQTVFEGVVIDTSVGAYTDFSPGGAPVHVLYRRLSYFEAETFVYTPADGKKHKVPFPKDAEVAGVFAGHLLATLRSAWTEPRAPFPAGALVSVPVAQLASDAAKLTVETVFHPGPRSTLNGVTASSEALYLDLLENVQGKVLKVARKKGRWQFARLSLPPNGVAKVAASDSFGKEIYVSYESFIVPTTLYRIAGGAAAPKAVKSLPARFDASGLQVEQLESVSRDGVKIPYFLVHKKGMPFDGKQPTLLYGYGGFQVSKTPYYSGSLGRAWLERGGAYAQANIRGGGEFGPKWHEAAILKNRQVAFDDFVSVAADLFRRHVSHPSRLALYGGSNGGLLMGVMLAQRPDLFKAAVAASPLLDMLRYTKMPTGTGASWVAEYGDPDDPAMAAVLGRYSPYHNLKVELKYPRVFFEASTEDDRVSPGHARKMVAKMEALGKDVLYHENIEGGHDVAADFEMKARDLAMEYTYLWNELGGTETPL